MSLKIDTIAGASRVPPRSIMYSAPPFASRIRAAPSTIRRCKSAGRIVSVNAAPRPCRKSKTSVSST
jgi:hypothetical protein